MGVGRDTWSKAYAVCYPLSYHFAACDCDDITTSVFALQRMAELQTKLEEKMTTSCHSNDFSSRSYEEYLAHLDSQALSALKLQVGEGP